MVWQIRSVDTFRWGETDSSDAMARPSQTGELPKSVGHPMARPSQTGEVRTDSSNRPSRWGETIPSSRMDGALPAMKGDGLQTDQSVQTPPATDQLRMAAVQCRFQ